MEQIKISLCVYQKNSKRQNAPYYARMRKDGRTTDIPLNTHDRAVAESWVRLRRDEISRFNDYLAVGETPPSDLLQKLPLDGFKTRKNGVARVVPTLRSCLGEWEADLRRRSFSERTIRTYTKSVEYVLKELSLPITSITTETVRWIGCWRKTFSRPKTSATLCSRFYQSERPKISLFKFISDFWGF